MSWWLHRITAAACAMTLTAVAFTACNGSRESAPAHESTSTTPARQGSPESETHAAPGDWSIAARIAMPGTPPFQMAVGYGYVWVVLRGPEGCSKSAPCALARIEPRTDHVIGRPTPLIDPWGLTTGAGSVWVTDFDGRLTRIDPHTGRVQARVDARPLYFGSVVASGDGAIWTGNDDERNEPQSVARVDPATNRVTGTVKALSPQSITYGDGAVWLADHAGLLEKIDPRTMKVLARTRLDFGPHGVVATRRATYVADAHGDRLLEADPDTARIRRIRNLPIGPIYPAIGGGSLWTTSATTWEDPSVPDDRVVRIDPRTLRIEQTIHLGSNGPSVTFGFGSAWVSLRSGAVVRLIP